MGTKKQSPTKTTVKTKTSVSKSTVEKVIDDIRKNPVLGKEIKIPATAKVSPHDQMHSRYFGKGFTLDIGIGSDHIATLIMDEEAHKAFLAGEKLTF